MTADGTEASGKASIAISGNATRSHVTTTQAEAPGGKVEINNYYGSGTSQATSITAPIDNLPPVASAFTGRGREEEEIVAALAGKGGSAAISALKGIGGVGKTALAIKIGHRLTVQFPDAQLLIDLRGTSDAPMASRAAMESVIRRFHPEGQLPDDDAAVLEIYRDLLHRKKVFLILDNARDTAQVEKLLPPHPSAAIVTSRQVLHLADAKSMRLDDLPLPDATALVSKLLDGERSLSEVEFRRLAQDCCFCHPLSLRVAALFLKGHKGRGVSDYIASVEKDRTRLKLQGLPDHDVLAVIGQSVTQLEAEDEGLCANWRDLSVFPSGFDTAAAAAVWNLDDRDIGSDRLCELEARGLIEPIADDRYRKHDLLRDVARRDWPAEQAEAAAGRHADHFRSVLDRADALYLQGGAAIAEGLSLFDRERTNIEAGQRWAAVARSEDAARLAAAYANAGVYVLSLRLHPREWIKWCEAALEGYRQIGDRYSEGNALGNLGLAYAHLGETSRAIEYFELSLTIAREIGDRRGEDNLHAILRVLEPPKNSNLQAQSIDMFRAITEPNVARFAKWFAEFEGAESLGTGPIKESSQTEEKDARVTGAGSDDGARRSLNAWISNLRPRVHETFRVTINIGRNNDAAAASVGFIEPDWGEAESIDLAVSVSCLDCTVEPSWQELKLPRTGESGKIDFWITARVAGDREFKVRVFLAKQMIQLQSLRFTVKVAEVQKELTEVQQ
jgi:tetratricopeptide (TPR) repeat protein